MLLSHIERGTKMLIAVENQQLIRGGAYEAVFRYCEDDTKFIVHCIGLYEIYDTLEWRVPLHIGFSGGPLIYKFTGCLQEKQRGSGMLLIEQLTDIKSVNRRQYERDEIRTKVQIFGLPDDMRSSSNNEKSNMRPALTDTTFDVSPGGLCVITDNMLTSEHDPYYLAEFYIGDKDLFLLPAKLVRRSNFQRSKIGKHDYGFQFLLDEMPEKKSELTKSILRRKLSFR